MLSCQNKITLLAKSNFDLCNRNYKDCVFIIGTWYIWHEIRVIIVIITSAWTSTWTQLVSCRAGDSPGSVPCYVVRIPTVIHVFISPCSDSCNSLDTGRSQYSQHELQSVQTAAARLLTETKRGVYITPILVSHHWLPVNFRINIKIWLVTFKTHFGLTPYPVKHEY